MNGVLKSNASYFLLLERNAHRSKNWTASNLLGLFTQWARFETSVVRGPWIVLLHVAECKVNMWVQMQQCAVIELLTAENVPLINVHWQMKVVCGEECGGISTGWCWTACVFVMKHLNRSRWTWMKKNGVEAPELQLIPLTWNTGKAESLMSRVCPHMELQYLKVTALSSAQVWEKLQMPELHCLGSCTVFLRLKLSAFHIFPKLKEHCRGHDYMLDIEVKTVI